MTNPSLPEAEMPIPDDVLQAARDAAAKVWAGVVDEALAAEFKSGMRDDSGSVETAVVAILAERQRCAGIADAHAKLCNSKLHKKRSDHDLAVFESAASEAASIVASIRGN